MLFRAHHSETCKQEQVIAANTLDIVSVRPFDFKTINGVSTLPHSLCLATKPLFTG